MTPEEWIRKKIQESGKEHKKIPKKMDLPTFLFLCHVFDVNPTDYFKENEAESHART